jgi:aminoglycoside 3-N-acetyltransferase
MDGWLTAQGLQREGLVENANARLSNARDIVTIALDRLAADPLVFLCAPSENCEECDEARASIAQVAANPLSA